MPLFSCLVGNDYTLAHDTILRDLQTKMGVVWGESRHAMIDKVARYVSKIPETIRFPMPLIENKSPNSKGIWYSKKKWSDKNKREH